MDTPKCLSQGGKEQGCDNRLVHKPRQISGGQERPLSQLSYQFDCHGIAVLVSQSPFFYLMMAPKHKSGEDGDLDMPKRNYQVLSLSEEVCISRKSYGTYIGFGVTHSFRHLSGVLGHIPCG